MRLILENVGLLKEADVAVDGITVMAAPNDTGKSTVAKSLYIALDIMNNYDEYYDEYYTDYAGRIVLELDNWLDYLELSKEDIPKYTDVISIVSEFGFSSENTTTELLNALNNVLASDVWSTQEREFLQSKLSEIQEMATRDEAKRSIANNIMKRYKYPLKENSVIKISEKERNIFERDSENFIWSATNVKRVFYTDTPLRFGEFQASDFIPRQRTWHYGMDYLGHQIVSELRDLVRLKYKDDNPFRKDLDKQEQFSQSVKDIIDGKFEYRHSGNVVFNRNNEDIELTNTATGIKVFAYLQLILDNYLANEKTLLILDEPEVNLHPVWQVKYVELLVRMHKELGVKIYINTHSTYIVEAIRLYAEYYEVDDVTHFYSIADDCTREVTRRLDVIYEQLNGAYEEMDEISEKILKKRGKR